MKQWGALRLAAVMPMSVWGCLPTEDPGKNAAAGFPGGGGRYGELDGSTDRDGGNRRRNNLCRDGR